MWHKMTPRQRARYIYEHLCLLLAYGALLLAFMPAGIVLAHAFLSLLKTGN